MINKVKAVKAKVKRLMKLMKARKPNIGDKFYPHFQSDYPVCEWGCCDYQQDGKPVLLTIIAVEQDYGNGGYLVRCDDKCGYDCFWSKKHCIWVYSLS